MSKKLDPAEHRVTVCISMPAAMLRDLDARAAVTAASRSALIRRMISTYLDGTPHGE